MKKFATLNEVLNDKVKEILKELYESTFVEK